MLEKFRGRALSSITEQEVAELPEAERQKLIEWMLQVELDYMVAEGMVDVIVNDQGDKMYVQNNHWNFDGEHLP